MHDVTVYKGGILRSGIKQTAPLNAYLKVDYDRKSEEQNYIWAEYEGTIGYVNQKNVRVDDGEIWDNTLHIVGKPGKKAIFDSENKEFLAENLPDAEIDKIGSVIAELIRVETTVGLTVDAKHRIVAAIVEGRNQPVQVGEGQTRVPTEEEKATRTSETTDTWLKQGIPNLEQVVLQRVNADKPELIAAGLISPTDVLKGVKFSGSDFHKGGQQVVFLRFEDNLGQENRIVYKPSSLAFDRQILGSQVNPLDSLSAATMLDPGGTEISNYKILPILDAEGEDQKYGYMEFVKEDLPQTKDDVLGVYKSVAANMALSFFIGLDDIHYENFIIRKDRIQLIDMEAATGKFTINPNQQLAKYTGAWFDQLWNKGISGNMKDGLGIRGKLKQQIEAKQLTELPTPSEIQSAMLVAFDQIIATAEAPQLEEDWEVLEAGLSLTRSRIVPIPTKAFYGFVDRFRTQDLSLQDWQSLVDTEPSIVKAAQEGHTSTEQSIKNILKSVGTYNALKRGDIPYYSRDLGSTHIYDEEDNQIDAKGHSKIGRDIETEVYSRRKPQKRDFLREIFTAQGIDKIVEANDQLESILQQLKPKENQPEDI
ncbi:type 2 lantipeptide synthetase LanM [Kovacikia minuta CCNUW1]|uniref:type 2 lantipeptide synthetase LanM n=1 Tax=Kovacikia minuta TaxID=2931930 RepID=UPI001CCCAB5D|nr:type 2 lantipeptide synthetase LanM [Kovacikia minuta]UBF26132.1 type 2 lantipeptide synthetase LanM [Kovacikia minuta CCNUW1]